MMSKTSIIILLCTAATCLSVLLALSPELSEENTLRIMTYNIRYANPGDGDHVWTNRRDRVASTIRFNNASVVGIQEALHTQLLDMDSLLTNYTWLGVGRDDGDKAGEYTAILYREERVEELESGTFWLSTTPDIPGSKDWDAAITRTVTWAKFNDRMTDKSFFLFNTHFDHRGSAAREESARLLVKKVQEIAGSYPTVITGDFNVTPDSKPYRILSEKLADAMYTSQERHHGPVDTYYDGFVVTHESGRRIDYIFTVNDVLVLQHATLSDSWNGSFASDHLAVVATIEPGASAVGND